MQCSRCGSEGHTEYGPDGQSYCSSCLFYGMNKPCWKCRMYLPSGELQMYRGQLTCQYCLMDLRDAKRQSEKPPTPTPTSSRSTRSEEDHLSHISDDERCDRCRRKLEIVYIFNNRKLCELCLKTEKDEWEEQGGSAGPTPMVVKFRLKGHEGLLSNLIHQLHMTISRIIDSKRASKVVKVTPKDEKKGDPPADSKDDTEAKGADGEDGSGSDKSIEKKPQKKKKPDDEGLEFEKYFYEDK